MKDNGIIEDSTELDFKRRILIVTWVTLVLPPVTGIFMLSFVGVFPFPEVFYPFTDYGALVLIISTLIALIIKRQFVNSILRLGNSPKTSKLYTKHLKRLPIYYFGILFLYFAVGLVSTLYSLSTLYGFNYPGEKYIVSFLGVIPGGLITALPIFFYLSDTLGKYLAPRGVHISIAPIKLKIIVLGLFIPVLIDTLLIMYYYDRTGYFSLETIGIWFFLIVIAGIGTTMAWQSFRQSLSPFVDAIATDIENYSHISITPQSLDELGVLSHRWHKLWLRVLDYEKQLASTNLSLRGDVHQRTQELESEKIFVNTILENTTAMVLILDSKGHIVRFNPACEKITGFSFTELHNQPIWEWLIPADQITEVRKVFSNLVNAGFNSQYENPLLKSDGDSVLVAWNNSTIKDKNGRVKYIVSIGIDISEREKSQLILQQAKEEAERANLAKSDFLSHMSHEFRTPMNAILGFSQLLEMDNSLNEDQRGSVDEIRQAGSHLLALINDILDLAKIEAGKLEINIEDINISRIIRDSLPLFSTQAKQRNIKLHNDALFDTDYIARTDKLRFKQVFINLVSNAIKYNIKNGEVFVEMSQPNPKTIRISVTDTGPGIPTEMRDKLFSPFERLTDVNDSHTIEGAGIGLSLSKSMMNLMEGSVNLEDSYSENKQAENERANNKQAKGSTFYIELPFVTKQQTSPS